MPKLFRSHFDEFKDNNFKVLYTAWPVAAVAVNTAAKVYADRLNRNLRDEQAIFTIKIVETGVSGFPALDRRRPSFLLPIRDQFYKTRLRPKSFRTHF
jgi:hypothetical protein